MEYTQQPQYVSSMAIEEEYVLSVCYIKLPKKFLISVCIDVTE